MLQTVEAIIDENGEVHLLEKIEKTKARRAIITILNEEASEEIPNVTALLSEKALSDNWDRPEEDEAWEHLQQER